MPDHRRGAVLGAVQVNAPSFTLGPRRSRTVEVRLRSVPSTGYLYAAVLARGEATDKRPGLRPSYEIATALHLEPAAARRRFALSASAPRATKAGRGVRIAVAVRNAGNMTDPVGGSIVVRGSKGTRTAQVRALPILPGETVRLPAAILRGLPAGTYRVTATLTQRTGRARSSARFTITRSGKVKR